MKLIFKFSIILVVLVFAISCHREKKDFIGPGYIEAPDGFAVTSFVSSATLVNFSTAPQKTITFDATFSSTVSWVLTITGQESGAVTTYTGTSNGFSGLKWKGAQTNVYFFRNGEDVTATLSFYGTRYTQTLALTIAPKGAPYFKNLGVFSKGGDFEDYTIGHILVSDSTNPITYSNYGWSPFNFPTAIPNVNQWIASNAVDYKGNRVNPVEGLSYYYIKGLGNQSAFVSGMQYEPFAVPPSRNQFFSHIQDTLGTNASPDNIWVNIYIYGTGDPNNSVDLEYQEDDLGSSVGYNGASDDAWVAHLTLDHKGWKLFSIKYSDLVLTSNKLFGGSGNHIKEPSRLYAWDLVLIKKTNPNSPVEVYYDYPIITVGGPFKPTNN